MRNMIRIIIERVEEVVGAIKRVSGTGVAGETFSGREYFQHYGFSSRPLAGAEGIVCRQGNHLVQIASDDRRFRLAIEDGEVVVYDDQGQRVHFKRNKEIHVKCLNKLTADVTNEAVINTQRAMVNAGESITGTSPLITAAASTKVVLDTPLTEITGNLTVAGTAAVQGAMSSATSVSDPTGTMQTMRSIYNRHTHDETGDGGGVTGKPNQQQ